MSDFTYHPKLTPSLYPGMIPRPDSLAREGTLGERIYQAIDAAQTRYYEAAVELRRREEQALAAVNEAPGRKVEILRSLAKGAARVTKAADAEITAHLSKARRHREELQAKIDSLLDGDDTRGAEIRAMVRSLPEGDRAKFVYSRIKAGDRETARAVTLAPPYLSGFDDRQPHEAAVFSDFRVDVARHFAPAELEQIEATDQALATIERTGQLFGKVVGEVTSHHQPADEERAQALARELEA